MNLTLWMTALLAVAAGLIAGVLITTWRLRKEADVSLRVPARWPLEARGLVNEAEDAVWKWLRSAFHDHLVMVKVPVLRFTIPMAGERTNSAQWLELLSGVYTTFTVCTSDGTVVGCVDVPGKRGLGQANRELKEALLADCNISYTVVRSHSLPKVEAMRAAFLGEIVDEFLTEPQPVYGQDGNFQAEVAAFTREKMRAAKDAAQREINRHAQQAPGRLAGAARHGERSGPDSRTGPPSQFPKEWDDSFIQPLDSRPARLT